MNNSKPELDTLIASLFYLMSRFAKKNEPGLVEAISMHLQMVLEHPDSKSEAILNTCRRLQCYWSSIYENDSKQSLDTAHDNSPMWNRINIH